MPESDGPGFQDITKDSRSAERRHRDLQLVADAVRGNRRARNELAKRLRCVGSIYAYLNAKRGNPLGTHELEDRVQSTVILLWERLASFRGSCVLETWVYGYCQYGFLTAQQKMLRVPISLDEEVGASLAGKDGAENDLRREELEFALGHLLKEESEVVRMKHYLDLTFDEIALYSGISANTAKSRYYRALRRLRALLIDGEGGDR